MSASTLLTAARAVVRVRVANRKESFRVDKSDGRKAPLQTVVKLDNHFAVGAFIDNGDRVTGDAYRARPLDDQPYTVCEEIGAGRRVGLDSIAIADAVRVIP